MEFVPHPGMIPPALMQGELCFTEKCVNHTYFVKSVDMEYLFLTVNL